jgi:flagellar biosynthesis/type III secretory pathway M-ring protein FliF/YscJ
VSISVLLDQKTAYERNVRGRLELKPVAWTQEELDKFRNMVIGSAGIDNARGDIVTVDSIAFASTADPMAEEAEDRRRLMDIIKIATPFAIILLTLMGWGMYKFATRPRPEPEEEEEEEEEVVEEEIVEVEEEEEEEIAEEPPKTLEDIKRGIEKEFIEENEADTPEALRREAIKQRVTDLVASDPENAASLVRTWLLDDAGGK